VTISLLHSHAGCVFITEFVTAQYQMMLPALQCSVKLLTVL